MTNDPEVIALRKKIESWFTNEEIADYWGVRYEDCDKDASSWSDG